jgi:hypothetical protein
MPIKWMPIYDELGRVNRYAKQSDCGQYTITHIYTRDEMFYEPWFKQTCLGTRFAESAHAEAFANAHRDARRAAEGEPEPPGQSSLRF